MDIILCGCCGHMGRAVAEAAAAAGHRIAAGVDRCAADGTAFPVYPTAEAVTETADVLIDFSHPSALSGVLATAIARQLPTVIATTGLDDAQIAAIRAAATKIPVFFSSNMSVGVAVLAALTKKAAAVLGADFDVELVEMHHNRKLDAPSGTALMLADAARQGLAHPVEYVYDRHDRRQKRAPEEIGISSVRGGNIVGEHQVIFAGGDEVLTLTHRAQSRGIFAAGALRAAAFLMEQPAGLYTMESLVQL